MSKLFATAGSTIHIGGAMSADSGDLTAADFTSQTWTEIGGTTNLGSAGDTSELITSNHINESRTRKAKGTRNAGSMEILADLDYSDAGQLAVIAAEKSDAAYAFRIVLNDGGSERLFVAYVMSAGEQFDEANSIMKLAPVLEIDSNIVRVAPTSGG